MVIPVTLKCKNCGMVFGVVINEEQIDKIPCPGCAGHDFERTNEATDFYWLSSEAEECSGDCACCSANCAHAGANAPSEE